MLTSLGRTDGCEVKRAGGVNNNREKCNAKLPQEISRKHQRMMTLQKVLAEPVNTEQDLARLNRQREILDCDVKVLQEKIQSKYGNQGDLQLRQQTSIAKQVREHHTRSAHQRSMKCS